LGGISVSFFRIPSPSGGAERAKKGRTIIHHIFLLKAKIFTIKT
jgi:hypothetical protein